MFFRNVKNFLSPRIGRGVEVKHMGIMHSGEQQRDIFYYRASIVN
jgi:hypothetical protein